MLPRFATAVQKFNVEKENQIIEILEEFRCSPDEFNVREIAKEAMRISWKPVSIPLWDFSPLGENNENADEN